MAQLPLHQVHVGLRARLSDDASWQVPWGYGDLNAEYHAARQGAALWDLSHRGKLLLTGSDRVRFAHNLFSNNMKSLSPGQGVLAALLTDKGRMVADLVVYCRADDLFLELEPPNAQKVRQFLGRYIIADDVHVRDVTTAFALLSVQGPGAAQVVAQILGELPVLNLYHWVARQLGEHQVLLSRRSRTLEGGYDLFVPIAGAAALWDALLAAGGRPAGLEALEVLRMEAGFPRYGLDMDESAFPQEARLERAVSYNKGCYLGQEVMARLEARGHLNRWLVGLLLDGTEPVAPRTSIQVGAKEVGFVTSSVRSLALGRPIALAYVRLEYGPGSIVTLGDGRTAQVVEPPFYAVAG